MSFVGIFLIPMVQPSAQGGDLGLAKLLPLVGRSGTAVAPGATAGDRGCQLVHQLLASQGQFGAIQGDRVCDGARTQHFRFAQVNQDGTLFEPVGQGPWAQFHNSETGLGNQAFIGSSAYSVALLGSDGITLDLLTSILRPGPAKRGEGGCHRLGRTD